MPTYVYRCRECRHEFEVRQRITEEPLKACPLCDAPVERVIFGNGVIFKGDGYYTTDYVRQKSDPSVKEPAEK
jgi:putative FmdB family regulatory protein